MEEIKTGTVVQLNSGGPSMTVEFIEKDAVTCQWFEGKQLKQGTFPIASLKIYHDGPLGVYRSR